MDRTVITLGYIALGVLMILTAMAYGRTFCCEIAPVYSPKG